MMGAARSFRAPTHYLWVAVPLLLIFWLSRLVAIDQFPPFIDEGLHVYFGEVTAQNHPLVYGNQYNLFAIWWWGLLGTYQSNAIWAGRVATLLTVMPGFAVIFYFGRREGGFWGALAGSLLYLFSTYHLFFDRLILADPMAASMVLVTLFFSARLKNRFNLLDAALTGLAAFLAVGIKLSSLPYLAVPFAAFLTLNPPSNPNWSKKLRWLGVALMTEALCLLAFAVVLIIARRNPFAHAFLHVNRSGTGNLMEILNTVPPHFSIILENLNAYISPLGLALLLGSLGWLILHRRYFWVLCLLGPASVYLVSTIQSSRYYAAPMGILLVCGTLVCSELAHRFKYPARFAMTMLLGIWVVFGWLPFASAAYRDATRLPIAPNDRNEYMTSDATGIGLPEIAAELQRHQPETVLGLLSNCYSLRYLVHPSIDVQCFAVNPTGEDIAELTTLMEREQRSGVFVVLETVSFMPADAPGERVFVLDHPSGRPRLRIYDLQPGQE